METIFDNYSLRQALDTKILNEQNIITPIRKQFKDKNIQSYIKNNLKENKFILDDFIYISLNEDSFIIYYICPICGSPLIIMRKNKNGCFLRCKNFSHEKNNCIKIDINKSTFSIKVKYTDNPNFDSIQKRFKDLKLEKEKYLNLLNKFTKINIKHFKSEV